MFSALPAGSEGPRAFHEGTILALKADHVLLARQRLAVHFFEHGFVIPQVHVRGGSRAKDLEHAFGPGHKVRSEVGGGFRRGLPGQQASQRHAHQAGCGREVVGAQ